MWHLGRIFNGIFNRNSYIFIHENAFENFVWKMAVILSRPQCFNQFLVDSCHLLTPYFARLLDDWQWANHPQPQWNRSEVDQYKLTKIANIAHLYWGLLAVLLRLPNPHIYLRQTHCYDVTRNLDKVATALIMLHHMLYQPQLFLFS